MLNDDILGTGIILNNEFVLIPRHCVEGKQINTLQLQLETSAEIISCICIVAESEELDYAILKVNALPDKIIPPTFDISVPDDTLLLHYAIGKYLMVSGHSKAQENSEHYRIDNVVSVDHDTDNESSGGAYVNGKSAIVTIHLGVDLYADCNYSQSASMGTGFTERDILSIEKIVDIAPDRILARLMRGDILKESLNIEYMNPSDRSLSWEREKWRNRKETVKAEGKEKKEIGTYEYEDKVYYLHSDGHASKHVRYSYKLTKKIYLKKRISQQPLIHYMQKIIMQNYLKLLNVLFTIIYFRLINLINLLLLI